MLERLKRRLELAGNDRDELLGDLLEEAEQYILCLLYTSFPAGEGGASLLPPSEGERAGRACCGRSGRARRGIRTCRGEGRISQDICTEGTAKVRGWRLAEAGCGWRGGAPASAGADARGGASEPSGGEGCIS